MIKSLFKMIKNRRFYTLFSLVALPIHGYAKDYLGDPNNQCPGVDTNDKEVLKSISALTGGGEDVKIRKDRRNKREKNKIHEPL